ncbi:MAG: 30S ribosomal protein S4e [Candidatus Woesearchaeota archaeon]
MTKAHLKRINAPKQWKLLRKDKKFVTRPNPGPHSFSMAMPLGLAIRQLGLANNRREVVFLLNTQEVFVDWRRKKDLKSQIGFLDTLSIPKQNIYYRMLFDKKGKLCFKKTDEKDSVLKISKIVNKTQNKGKTQLGTLDGRNIIVENGKNYSVGDSVLFELPEQKIKSVLKMEKGKTILLYKGKFTGNIATIEKIEGKNLLFKINEEKFQTDKNFAIVVGEDKPLITLS